jgi:hypothetical protein
MKKTSYFFILIIAFSLISGTVSYGLNSKDQKEEKSTQQQTPESKSAKSDKGTTIESGWLNAKNFPWLQQSPCPFYIKPGC